MRFYHVFRSAALAASTAIAVTVVSGAALSSQPLRELDRQLDAARDDPYLMGQSSDEPQGEAAARGLEHLATLLGGPLAPLDQPAALAAPAAVPAPATGSPTEILPVSDNRTVRPAGRSVNRKASPRSQPAASAPRSHPATRSRSTRTSRSSTQQTAVTHDTPSTSQKPATPPAPPAAGSAGSVALRYAYAQIGKAYRSSSAGPNTFDCSGLTMAAWRAAGVSLPHSASGQYRSVTRIGRSDLRPGDLVFFYSGLSHVGIYAGNNMVIDAPRTGKRVSLRSISIMPAVGYGRPSSR